MHRKQCTIALMSRLLHPLCHLTCGGVNQIEVENEVIKLHRPRRKAEINEVVVIGAMVFGGVVLGLQDAV